MNSEDNFANCSFQRTLYLAIWLFVRSIKLVCENSLIWNIDRYNEIKTGDEECQNIYNDISKPSSAGHNKHCLQL
jgi:hypothetical protein